MKPQDGDEFERRTRALLDASCAHVNGRVRSRLTRARHAALSARRYAARPWWRVRMGWRTWAPAGAVAAAVLVMLFMVGQPASRTQLPGSSGDATGAIEDIELLADADALDLAQEQAQRKEADFDFYEWATATAGGEAAAVGT